MLLSLFGAPLLSGSPYGPLITFPLVGVFAVRAVKEEKTLKQELEGYESYTREVKYRFIPKIWRLTFSPEPLFSYAFCGVIISMVCGYAYFKTRYWMQKDKGGTVWIFRD